MDSDGESSPWDSPPVSKRGPVKSKVKHLKNSAKVPDVPKESVSGWDTDEELEEVKKIPLENSNPSQKGNGSDIVSPSKAWLEIVDSNSNSNSKLAPRSKEDSHHTPKKSPSSTIPDAKKSPYKEHTEVPKRGPRKAADEEPVKSKREKISKIKENENCTAASEEELVKSKKEKIYKIRMNENSTVEDLSSFSSQAVLKSPSPKSKHDNTAALFAVKCPNVEPSSTSSKTKNKKSKENSESKTQLFGPLSGGGEGNKLQPEKSKSPLLIDMTDKSISPLLMDPTNKPVSPLLMDITDKPVSPLLMDTTDKRNSPCVMDTTEKRNSPCVIDTTDKRNSPCVIDTTDKRNSPRVIDMTGKKNSPRVIGTTDKRNSLRLIDTPTLTFSGCPPHAFGEEPKELDHTNHGFYLQPIYCEPDTGLIKPADVTILADAVSYKDYRHMYQFDYGHKHYYQARMEVDEACMMKVSDSSEKLIRRGWREVFGTLGILANLVTVFFVELITFLSKSIFQVLVVGLLTTLGDHIIKPLLVALFNSVLQPFLIFLLNILSSLRNLTYPFIDVLRGVSLQLAMLLRAFRLVDVHTNQSPPDLLKV